MKKTFSLLLAVLLFSCLVMPAAAEPISSYDLFTQWENGTYPDYVTGVFYNAETQNLSIILTENTPERQAEINAMLSDAAAITYFAGQYSHAELEAVRAAITAELSAQEGEGHAGVGIGWSVVSGGFGESGYDFRVVVDAEDEKAAEYTEKFAEEYGDIVVVDTVSDIRTVQESAAQNATVEDTAAEPQGGLSNWGIIGIVAICLAGLVFGVNRFMKSRHKEKKIQL